MSQNVVLLVGNLGADPEVRTTANGTQIANLRVATSSRRKDASGNWGEKTEWHRVKVIGKSAEFCGRFLKKGAKVSLTGEIETSTYEKDGEKRYSTEIVTFDVRSEDRRGDTDQPREGGGGGRASPEPPIPDEDIPF